MTKVIHFVAAPTHTGAMQCAKIFIHDVFRLQI